MLNIFGYLAFLSRRFFWVVSILITFALTLIYRRIYTTFILGTALQTFGTRAYSFGHCPPLDLHDKACASFCNVDFWNGTPETKVHFVIMSPCAYVAVVHLWLQADCRISTDWKLACFGVSVAFVCTCIKKVCEAFRNKMASETSQSFKTCMLSN